jgi:aerobic carbon-monoxide dehydrogenase small subunit
MPAVTMTVNGELRSAEVEGRTVLVQFLRDQMRMTGIHVGCDTRQCGACTDHVDDVAIKSCTELVLAGGGKTVTTIDGLAKDGKLHPMQHAFHDNHGLQRGFCTPGIIMSAINIVRRNGHDLDDRTVRRQLDGNICRCTGYQNIVKAIQAVAVTMRPT